MVWCLHQFDYYLFGYVFIFFWGYQAKWEPLGENHGFRRCFSPFGDLKVNILDAVYCLFQPRIFMMWICLTIVGIQPNIWCIWYYLMVEQHFPPLKTIFSWFSVISPISRHPQVGVKKENREKRKKKRCLRLVFRPNSRHLQIGWNTPSRVWYITWRLTWWGTSSSYPLELPVAQHAMETSAELAIPSYTDRT